MENAQRVIAEELRLLVALLAHPAPDSLATLADWADDAPWLDAARRELAQTPLSHWQAEHTRLFINGHPTTVCPPFASVYLHGQMYGPATIAAQELYQSLGLTPALDIPSDYLGMLLECAIFLIENEQQNAPSWNALWNEYLMTWIGDFATDLQRESQLIIYRALGERIAFLLESAANA